MKIIYKLINDLTPYENNPRNNKDAIKYVAESIKEFGFKVPIVIDSSNIIVAGHTRLLAAKSLKLKEVPCIIADDLNDKQIKAYRLADNKVSEFSDWDMDLLVKELDDLTDMDLFGFELNYLLDDNLTDDFTLNDSDKSEFCQITFTLHEEQAEFIKEVIKNIKECDENFNNTKSNGNKLYEVFRQWAELKK